MTTELLQTIYNRAMQYCHAKFGKEADELHIIDDGSFKVIWGESCRGQYYEDEQYFGVECLSADLDAVYAERKQLEEEARLKQQKENEKRDRERKQRETEERKQQYLKLKKEFED